MTVEDTVQAFIMHERKPQATICLANISPLKDAGDQA